MVRRLVDGGGGAPKLAEWKLLRPPPRPQWLAPGAMNSLANFCASCIAAELLGESLVEGDGLIGRDDRVGPALEDDELAAARLELARDRRVAAPLRIGPSSASTFGMSRSRSKLRQFQSAPNTHLNRPSNDGSPGALEGASRNAQLSGPTSLPGGQP